MEEIRTMSGMNLTELRDAAKDRDVWRKLTMAIDRTHRADSTIGDEVIMYTVQECEIRTLSKVRLFRNRKISM